MARGSFSRALLLLITTLGLTAVFSCNTFDLPAEICNPGDLSSKSSPADCDRCLEDHCCDAVGVCERTDGCAKIVSQTQECILLAGPRSERSCAENNQVTLKKPGTSELVHPEADGAYRCMRGSCGAQCGLPVCQVDQAARLIFNPPCDQCFAGSCCPELNRCYANRACKLTVECIISSCGGTLGTALKDPDGGAPNGGVTDPAKIAALCDDPSARTGLPECVRTCLCAYRGNDLGIPPEGNALSSLDLAAAVYNCGRTSACGDACSSGPIDAGGEADAADSSSAADAAAD